MKQNIFRGHRCQNKYIFFFFLSDPPDIPQKLNCETYDLKEIICTWDPGRPTALVGPRSTSYTLFER